MTYLIGRGGDDFRVDNEVGLVLGRAVAAVVIERARKDRMMTGCPRLFLQRYIQFIHNIFIQLRGQLH